MMMKALAKKGTQQEGKTDLLLRFFESQFFDEWICLQYLYQNNQPGVHDYLCNKLYELPEASVEKYLLEFVYLAVNRPGSPLERTIIALCHKSFRIAVKVNWLLLAMHQDNPKSKHVEQLRERCERAALEGKWEVPFRDPHLDPLSPMGPLSPPNGMLSPTEGLISPPYRMHQARQILSPVLSPTFQPPSNQTMAMSPPQEEASSPPGLAEQLTASLRQLLEGASSRTASTSSKQPVSSGPVRALQHSISATPAATPATDNSGHGGRPDSTAANGTLAQLKHSTSGLAIDLGCLLPGDPRAPTAANATADPATASATADATAGPSATASSANAQHPVEGITVDPIRTSHAAPAPVGSAGAAPVAIPGSSPRRPSSLTSVGKGGSPVGSSPQGDKTGSAAVRGEAERIRSIRQELGEGEGVTALLESSHRGNGPVSANEEDGGIVFSDDEAARPVSPMTRLRRDTFGATMDFMEALCDASSSLTSFSQEERQRALRHGLETINREIETAARRDVAIWFPLGKNERVLRLAAKEAVLLNSREKAPFLLFVEVLDEEVARREEEEAAAKEAGAKALGDSTGSLVGSSSSSSQAVPSVDTASAPAAASSSAGGTATASAAPPTLAPAAAKPPLPPAPSATTLSTSSIPSTSGGTAQGPVSGTSTSGGGALPKRKTQAGDKEGKDGLLTGVAKHLCFAGPAVDSPDFHRQQQASQSSHHMAPLPPGPSHPHAELTPIEMEELIASGCFSPPRVPSQGMMDRMSDVIHSLRGEAPLVRLQIRVLPEPLPTAGPGTGADAAGAGPVPAVVSPTAVAPSTQQMVGGSSSGGAAGGSGGRERRLTGSNEATSSAPAATAGSSTGLLGGSWGFSLAGLTLGGSSSQSAAPAQPALSAGSTSGTSGGGAAAPASAASGPGLSTSGSLMKRTSQEPPGGDSGLLGKSPVTALLSKLGLCRKPDVDHDGDLALGAAGASWASDMQGGALGQPASPPLVQVRLVVAGGINLSIASPHRKHARTPSNEALSLIASKYKVQTIPPPYESGPPAIPPVPSSGDLAGLAAEALREQQQPGPPVPPGSTLPSQTGGTTGSAAGPTGTAEQQQQPGQPRNRSRLSSESGQGQAASAPSEGLGAGDLSTSLQAAFPTAGQSASWPSASTHPTKASVLEPLPPLHQQQQILAAALQPPQPPASLAQGPSGAVVARRGSRSGSKTEEEDEVLDPAAEEKRKRANAVYGERWAQKAKRIQKESPQGRRKGWSLRCVIVKSGDDCRQELLAVQLIRTFHEIFQEHGLPLWVRPYEVLVTSNRTALIEMVPDAPSVHTVKQRSLPHVTSFSELFFNKFGRGTRQCRAAQRNFTESLAAYSIVCYLLQMKDRHNGNILLDDEGHLVHIDFGFMLSNSPGGVNFETAPFKLTRELLEVMDSNSEGKPSELFDYFKVLVIQGFLATRKHHDRVLLLVKMMAKSGFPCFKGGDRAVKNLEKRFQLQLAEVQCVQMVLTLISDSLDAWRTRQYDYYQRVLNGIL